VRFQVFLPTPFAVVAPFVAEGARNAMLPASRWPPDRDRMVPAGARVKGRMPSRLNWRRPLSAVGPGLVARPAGSDACSVITVAQSGTQKKTARPPEEDQSMFAAAERNDGCPRAGRDP
jgi:hypothetical protein